MSELNVDPLWKLKEEQKMRAETVEAFWEAQAESGQVIYTHPSGAQKEVKDERFSLIPHDVLRELATLYGVGAKKYSDRNWEKGQSYQLVWDALHRHLNKFWSGEYYDEETGSPHLICAIFHLMSLTFYHNHNRGTDDRPRY